MSEASLPPLETGEQYSPVMVYTSSKLIWGQLLHKTSVTPGRILVGVTVPDYLTIFQAQVILADGRKFSERYKFDQVQIPVQEVIGFHLVPPNVEPPDYDPDEPNRKMAPTTALVGNFQFMGHLRISTATDVKRTLDVSKSIFLPLYDVEVCTVGGENKPFKINYALVRREKVLFTVSL